MTRWAEACLTLSRGEFAAAQTATHGILDYLQTSEIYCYPWRAEVGTRFWQAHMLTALGHQAQILGDYPTALGYYRRADSLREALGEQRYKAINLRSVASLLRLTGAHEQALTAAHGALTLSQSLDDRLSTAYAELVAGQIEADAGRYRLAAEHCGRSLSVAVETGEHRMLMRSLVELARVDLGCGHPGAARRRLEEAIAAFVQLGEPHSNHLAAVYIGLGQVACAEEKWPQARQMLCQALTTSGRSVWETLAAIAAMAEVEWAQGDGVRAARLLFFVVTHTATANPTRQRTHEILQRMGEPLPTEDDPSPSSVGEPLLTLESAYQVALRSV